MIPEIWKATDNFFFVILGHFLPFNTLKTQKMKIMKKMKQKAEDIIILEMCTINDNHMMHGF